MTNQKPVGLLFLDAEYTGVTTDPMQAWEIGWILDIDGEIISQQSYYLEHTTAPSDWVLKNTLYKKIFKDETIYKCSSLEVCSELLKQIEKYKEQYEIYVVGAAVQGDLNYLLKEAKKHNIDLGLNWRVIDLSNVFLGYQWGKGISMDKPIAVPHMLKALNIKTSGKRHGVDVDNQDLRNIYYKLKIDKIPENKI